MRTFRLFSSLLAAAALAASAPASAQELTKTHVKVIGNYSTVAHVAEVEQRFWSKTIPKCYALEAATRRGSVAPGRKDGATGAPYLKLSLTSTSLRGN